VSARAAALDRLDTIRARCAQITAHVTAGASPHLFVDRARLPAAVAATLAATRERYPSLDIPPHSRWRHFDAGNVPRLAALDAALASRSPTNAARARFDLAVMSVLLDAGAGAGWRYRDVADDVVLSRSEGLAVATHRAFMDGAFSADARDPLRVDAAVLGRCDAAMLARVFQADATNPLVGLAGRAAMLRRLGEALDGARPARWFDEVLDGARRARPLDAVVDAARPARELDEVARDGETLQVDMRALFATLRNGLRHVLPGRLAPDGVPLGDCWAHPAADDGLVPFHKLTQWLAYSLVEPLQSAGIVVGHVDALTGLPEYRNGGLLLDTGVLQLRDPAVAACAHAVDSEIVVEGRALTVTLLDEVAAGVRSALRRPDLPMAAVLEGGTWAAGRALAAQQRDGRPPLTVESDGTVF
jgi:hypothetical protein